MATKKWLDLGQGIAADSANEELAEVRRRTHGHIDAHRIAEQQKAGLRAHR